MRIEAEDLVLVGHERHGARDGLVRDERLQGGRDVLGRRFGLGREADQGDQRAGGQEFQAGTCMVGSWGAFGSKRQFRKHNRRPQRLPIEGLSIY